MGSDKFDFSGWATKNDTRCADGRTIRRDAFKHNDGQKVPLVWNHQHSDARSVLGYAILENRPEGVYTYGYFNDSEEGQFAKLRVMHGDITSLSIYANHLKQKGGDVLHGEIREVSLVLAGANPGATIDSIMVHSDNGDYEYSETEAVIYTGEEIEIRHSDEDNGEEKENHNMVVDEELLHGDDAKNEEEPTVKEVIDTMNDDQKNVLYYCVAKALETDNDEDSEGGSDMKHNVFEEELVENNTVLSHSDQEEIIGIAKQTSVGSLQEAISIFAEQNGALEHSIDSIETLFPEYEDVRKGAPEMLTTDQGWIASVINGAHKSPISRIRTRQADARQTGIRAKGYKKGDEKAYMGNIKLLSRTTDPQTIYVKDKLNRDDIIDITDFDVVDYQYKVMRMALNEELAIAMMVGDGREEGDEHKIDETHIRSIWHDDELYTIHKDVDIAAAKAELQGSDTSKHFSDNYVYAEAIISAALYSRENYKGSGNLTFYCTPHLLNVMLLARDLNGRRIYDSKADLAAALNVKAIETAEQFEGLTRTDSQNKKHKLLGLFVNMSDYQVGSTKGGAITNFNQFDIDFNQEKYLMETRVSGALTRVYSAIALEEPVTEAQG